jgi:hypothetical protein
MQGKAIAGVPEDYLVVLETEDPELPTFFLEDIRGDLYPTHRLPC